jgi:hypothetical protein
MGFYPFSGAGGAGGGSVATIYEASGTYPLRATATSSPEVTVIWVGPDAPQIGGGYAVNDVDLWIPVT